MSDTPKILNDLKEDEVKRLMDTVFRDADPNEGDPDYDPDYPKTIDEKASYAEHCATSSLQYIGQAIKRLSRFHRLLLVAKSELPKIIAYNEARVARDRLIRVQDEINDAILMMVQIMAASNEDKKETDRAE